MGKKKKARRLATVELLAPAARPSERRVFGALLAILLVAAALRCWRLDAPVGGFHAVNEANYLLIAERFVPSSLLTPTPDGRSVFLETPPLYPYLISAVFAVSGVSVLAARLVSVVPSLGLVVATFLLGRRLFGPQPALMGSLLVAVSPVAVLTGRNIQTDSTLLLFLVMGLFYWQRAETGGRRNRILSGVFFGLALFTKLFALVSMLGLLVWETLRGKGLGWLRDRTRWTAAGIAAILPLLFYGYHALTDFPHFRKELLGGAVVATTFPLRIGEWAALGIESLWAFSPFLFLLVLAGIGSAVASPTAERILLLTQLLSFLLFYLFVHKHSYYLLTLLPFGALLAGDLLERAGRSVRVACLATAITTGVFFSAIDITSMKLGFREFADLSPVAGSMNSTQHIYLVDASFYENASTVAWADPRARLVVFDSLPAGPDRRLRLPPGDLYLLRFVPPQSTRPPVGWLFSRERYGLTLFGWTIAEAHPNPNFFRQGKYIAVHSGGLLDFGASLLRVYPALALLPIPPELALYRTERGLATAPPAAAPRNGSPPAK